MIRREVIATVTVASVGALAGCTDLVDGLDDRETVYANSVAGSAATNFDVDSEKEIDVEVEFQEATIAYVRIRHRDSDEYVLDREADVGFETTVESDHAGVHTLSVQTNGYVDVTVRAEE